MNFIKIISEIRKFMQENKIKLSIIMDPYNQYYIKLL